MKKLFENFRRYMAENDEDDWEDEEDALPKELESFRRIVTQEYWQEKRPHLEIPSDQMFDMALKLEKIEPRFIKPRPPLNGIKNLSTRSHNDP